MGKPTKSRPVMGEDYNVVLGQGLKVNKAKSTLSSPSICLMRHIEGEEIVLVALLTFEPLSKNYALLPLKNIFY